MSGTAAAPHLISVDWGTTSLRCWLVGAEGVVLDARLSERGILKTDGVAFADVLAAEIAGWFGAFGDAAAIPVILSGMIGSRQDWQEARYLRCPASPDDLGRNLERVETAGTTLGRCRIAIVPGMDIVGDAEEGELPDVMRGEETQVLGALIAAGLDDGVFVLPGTHSKWVVVEDGSIIAFRTFMTGEVYAALLDATILGRLAGSETDHAAGFARGVEVALASTGWAGPGNLLNMVFSARSRVLHGELEEAAVRSYLSGLLIGAELQAGVDAAWFEGQHSERDEIVLRIIADAALAARYATAAELSGFQFECADGAVVPRAHFEIAKRAGLVS